MRRCVLLLILFAGCDVLFPEFAGMAPQVDAAVAADGDTRPEVTGSLCVLGDVRDIRACATGVPSGMHVTVEETRDAANVDATGNFTLPLSMTLDNVTLAAADPTGNFEPTVTSLHLTGGRAVGVAVPVVRANLLSSIATQNGLTLDPSRGVILAWTANSQGVAVAGAVATPPAGASAPLYDGPQAGAVLPGRATGPHGLVALFDVPPGNATFVVGGVQFTLPVRADAVTLSTLIVQQ